MNRARPQSSPKSFELNKCSTVTTMAPPKPAEPGQTTRPTRVQTRSRGPLEENEQQQLEIVDIDEIPSPEVIPVNPTPILEEIQQPQAGTMKEDTPAAAQEPQNEEAETQWEVQPESTQAAMEVNGMTQNLGATVQPDESQAPSLGQPTEETTGTTSAWPEWLMGEQSEVVGTSNQPPQQEDRVQIPSSPRKKPAAEIVLPCIPDGVQVEPQLLGQVGKLKYSDHDVSDETKFPELAQRVFMQTITVNQLGEMISQPHQWAVGLDRTRILGLLKLPHFGRGQYATTCVKQLLAVMHGGDIWLDKPIPITVELIAQITGLPIRGMDPALILDDKSKEKALAEEMKKKYGTARGTRGIIIK
jgi:hypothetical protein